MRTDYFCPILIGGLILIKYPSFPVDRAAWGLVLVVFVLTFLIEVCFVSPYRHAEKIERHYKDVIHGLQTKLDWHTDQERKQCELKRQKVLDEAADLLKGAETKPALYFMPFHGLFHAGAGNLDRNEDVIWVCDKLSENHDHPFEGLGQCVFQSEWLKFLQWGKRHNNLQFDANADYLKGAQEWGISHGRGDTLEGKHRISRHLFDK